MEWDNWSALAQAVATFAQANLSCTSRGSASIRINADSAVVVAYFGNDYYCRDDESRRAVTRLRAELADAGLIELGFGLSDDACSWALIIQEIDSETARLVKDAECTNSI